MWMVWVRAWGAIVREVPLLFTALLVMAISWTTMQLRRLEGLSVWICYFVPLQIFLNWLQFMRHRSVVPVSIENYPGYVHRYSSVWYAGESNGPASAKDRWEEGRYKECLSCDMHVPIRSHHCPYCRRCIYILDHHCFFLGRCVGRGNLKFFIIFCFYASLGTGYGLLHILKVMADFRAAKFPDAIFYFFPFSAVMYCSGRTSALETYYVGLLNFGLGAMLMSGFLFCVGVWSVVTNMTPHEDKREKREHLREEPLTISQKFTSVFGDGGLLHFLFPLLPFASPYLEPGYRMLSGTHSLREVRSVRPH